MSFYPNFCVKFLLTILPRIFQEGTRESLRNTAQKWRQVLKGKCISALQILPWFNGPKSAANQSHFRLMQVVRSGSQICNQCYKWHHLVAKYASGATHYPVANFASGILRPNLQSMRKRELRTRQPGNVYPFRPISLRNHSLIIDKSLGGWKSVSHFVNKIISLIFLQHQVHWSA